MTISRLWQTIRLCLIRGDYKRGEYLRRKGIFAYMGENVAITDRKVPLYANLIKIHNNVLLASNVTLAAHDGSYAVLRHAHPECAFQEQIGCIEIMDNVFIGAGTTVLGGVRIGPNAIIGAGSLVNRDIPPNSVAAGKPARVVGSFDDFAAKKQAKYYPDELAPVNQTVSAELAELMWKEFDSARSEEHRPAGG